MNNKTVLISDFSCSGFKYFCTPESTYIFKIISVFSSMKVDIPLKYQTASQAFLTG